MATVETQEALAEICTLFKQNVQKLRKKQLRNKSEDSVIELGIAEWYHDTAEDMRSEGFVGDTKKIAAELDRRHEAYCKALEDVIKTFDSLAPSNGGKT